MTLSSPRTFKTLSVFPSQQFRGNRDSTQASISREAQGTLCVLPPHTLEQASTFRGDDAS